METRLIVFLGRSELSEYDHVPGDASIRARDVIHVTSHSFVNVMRNLCIGRNCYRDDDIFQNSVMTVKYSNIHPYP